jgi:glycosyltransferase involved in cell wall biosynthesis
MPNPKISIITVVFNGQSLIELTIKSVLEQTYKNVEYIVIDGASADGTLSIINRYKTQIEKIVSEKDKGIYDAMNKGISLATGEYILFLNAGDEFFEENTLENIFRSQADVDVYYGDTVVVNDQREVVSNRRLRPSKDLNWKSLQWGMVVCHQSFIIKRSLCNLYDVSFKISADFNWMIESLKKSKSIVNTNLTVSKFLKGGASRKHLLRSLKERFLIMSHHYGFFATTFNHIFISIRFVYHLMIGKSIT